MPNETEIPTPPVAPKLPSEGGALDANSEKLARLVAEKRAAGLPKEDAEQIARKQIEHDTKQAEAEAAESADTLASLRSDYEDLCARAIRFEAKLKRLEMNLV